ncbi:MULTISPECIES: hypothetical protein [unclassified Imperialibacter]|uniref:hypothetical protein n=1 Tax=unclassified Imperialibacter TaxID=2629706 RepID=UPI001255750A|nr:MULTISPECIES: hypothetical protein [unclassified Imperialibacter]CAD5265584.1 hypothetical protein IMPERIA89_300125 [Imperialibacter sp. 89]CAD5270399.1 hypothetical protein IMPERIA75_360125 [Imperialibacter sp. 75]VVT10039.1 hypothetical protein IMPR6_180127 [Imperialibacter sp. EC-SDR9]
MKWHKVIVWFVSLIIIGFFTIWWTMGPEPMKTAQPYSVNDPAMRNKVLIATQGSDFKDALVKEVVAGLEISPVFIQVIDISGLDSIKEMDWTAIVIIHSMEYWNPGRHVEDFVNRTSESHKLIVLSTSGEGSSKLEGIDGISSASRLSEVSEKSREIVRRVMAIISDSNYAVGGPEIKI